VFGKRKSGHSGGLQEPPAVDGDGGALEVLSVWIGSRDAANVVLKPDAFADPAMWGLLLVDIARHVSNAIGETGAGDAARVLERIRQGFAAEISSPTDTPKGSWIKSN
jgi:Domain of unknown function (DUF5076)